MRSLSARFLTILAILTGCTLTTYAADSSNHIHNAISGDPAVALKARAALRAEGPAGLAKLMMSFSDEIARYSAKEKVANWPQIAAAIEDVAMQRDAWASGVYWYTDLNEAKAAAQRDGKPILSLRLLGKLNTELSCANSRFFRTTLYPATEVSRRMRENFVLHWSSERPVPVITVDFGDGRVMKRTITGNSAHYMMTPDGQVVDVLPGLYSARAFATWLDEAGQLAIQTSALNGIERQNVLVQHHAERRAALEQRWRIDVQRINQPAPAAAAANGSRASGKRSAPSAREAGAVALSKSAGEARAVAELSRQPDIAFATADDRTWKQISRLYMEDAALDPAALKVIMTKQPPQATAQEAGERAMSKMVVESPLVRMLRSLERTIAEDTVRNEYQLHAQIHHWFSIQQVPDTFEALNERVYADLFLTPRSDPWLGLAPEDAWSALDGGGLTATDQPAPAPSSVTQR